MVDLVFVLIVGGFDCLAGFLVGLTVDAGCELIVRVCYVGLCWCSCCIL